MANEWDLPEGFVIVQRAQPQPVGTAEDMARAVPRGARDAVAGLAGMPVDLANFAMRIGTDLYNRTSTQGGPINGGVDATAPQIPAGGADTFRRGIDTAARTVSPTLADALSYEPQTTPGHLVRGGVEIGTSAAIPAALMRATPATIGRLFGIGGAAGLVGEGADLTAQRANMTEGARAALRTGSTLATAILGNRGFAANANASRMLGERAANITPIDWRAARAMEQRAVQNGVPLIGGEPLGPAGGPIQRLTADIRATPQGGPIDDALAQRQGQVQTAVAGPRGFLDRVSPDATVEAPMAARTAATSPRFEQAGAQTVDPLQLQQLIGEIDRAIAANGPATALGRDLAQYRRSLLQNMGAGTEGITPTTNPTIGPLYQQYKDWRRGLNPDTPPSQLTDAQREATGVIRPLNQNLRTTLRDASTTQAQAMDDFAALSPRVEAAQTRADLATEFDRALNAGGSQVSNPLVGARFAQNVRGRTGEGAQRAPELDQRLLEAAQARGAFDPQGAVRSANDFLDNLAYTNQIPGVGSPTAGRGVVAEEAGRNAGSTLARALNVTRGAVLDTARSSLTGATQGATYRRLAEVLASPNGIAEMERMIIANGGNPLTQVQLGNLAATLEAARTGELMRRP